MASLNIDHAQSNLRWCARAWKDGEMQDLALFLFRKAVSQLLMEDMSVETMSEVVISFIGREAFEDLYSLNETMMKDTVLYAGWQERVSCLYLC